MTLLNEQVTAETRRILSALRDPVCLTCFTQAECHVCGHVVDLAKEVAALSPHLRLTVRDFIADAAAAASLGVARVPALLLAREGEARIPVRYYGLPAGHEFGAFLRALLLLSTGRGMAAVDAAAVAPITRPARLMVFVLASCPRCAEMAYLCASIAGANPLVSADIIEAEEFPELISQYQVGAVPKVLINETTEVLDVVPAATLIAKIVAATTA